MLRATQPIMSNGRSVPTKPASFSVVSLFAGCGGLDLGFRGRFEFKDASYKKLPFDILKAYDNDALCVQTYKRNLGEHIEQLDLSDFSVAHLPKADVLIAGFPCQDFSACGPRAGLTSKRGQLYQALTKYMAHHRPKLVVAENVLHLAHMDKGEVLKQIVAEFEAQGYVFKEWRLRAADFGVPQLRARLFLVGVRDDLEGFPEEPVRSHENEPATVDWAISDLETVTDDSIPNQSQYFKANRAKNGHGQGDEMSQAGKPGYTVRSNTKSRIQFHYKLERRLTVRECARLQTFPDDFVFPHTTTRNIKQLGNAVPPLLGHKVAEQMAKFLKRLQSKRGPSRNGQNDDTDRLNGKRGSKACLTP